MKRWISSTLTGTGTSADPYRPDMKGVGGISGWVMATTNGTDCLCKVTKNQGPLDTLRGKAGVSHHGDETAEAGPFGTVYRVPANLRAALVAEAERLGVAGLKPEGYDVG